MLYACDRWPELNSAAVRTSITSAPFFSRSTASFFGISPGVLIRDVKYRESNYDNEISPIHGYTPFYSSDAFGVSHLRRNALLLRRARESRQKLTPSPPPPTSNKTWPPRPGPSAARWSARSRSTHPRAILAQSSRAATTPAGTLPFTSAFSSIDPRSFQTRTASPSRDPARLGVRGMHLQPLGCPRFHLAVSLQVGESRVHIVVRLAAQKLQRIPRRALSNRDSTAGTKRGTPSKPCAASVSEQNSIFPDGVASGPEVNG